MDHLITEFRESKGSWFRCPYCDRRSWTVLYRAEYRQTPRPRYRIVFQCQACNGLSERVSWQQRPLPIAVLAVASFAGLFIGIYYLLSQFATSPAVVLVLLFGASYLLAGQALGRLLNRYRPAETD